MRGNNERNRQESQPVGPSDRVIMRESPAGEGPAVVVLNPTAGNGRAGKQQVQKMMARQLGLDQPPEPPDVADALAIAFCYGQKLRRWRQAPGGSHFKEIVKQARAAGIVR